MKKYNKKKKILIINNFCSNLFQKVSKNWRKYQNNKFIYLKNKRKIMKNINKFYNKSMIIKMILKM